MLFRSPDASGTLTSAIFGWAFGCQRACGVCSRLLEMADFSRSDNAASTDGCVSVRQSFTLRIATPYSTPFSGRLSMGWQGFSLETTPIIPHFSGIIKPCAEGVRKMASPAWFLRRVYISHPCSARRRGFLQAESPHSHILSPLAQGLKG